MGLGRKHGERPDARDFSPVRDRRRCMTRISRRTASVLAALAVIGIAGGAGDRAASPAPQTHPAATAAPSEDRLVLALLEPERIVSLDPHSGAVAKLQLPGGTLCRSPLLVVDGRILFVQAGRKGGRVMSVDITLRERPRWIATADVMFASAEPGHVWLASRGVGPHGHWLVQDLSVADGTIAPRPRHAPSLPIVGAVSDGLVLGGRRSVFVWDPRTGRRSRATPGRHLVAAQGATVASCGGRCSTLRLADGQRGRVVHAPRGTSFVPGHAAFAPAEDLLAVPLASAGRAGLALVRVATGARSVVPLRIGSSRAFAWSPSGEKLYVVGWDDRVRVLDREGRLVGVAGPRFGAPIVQLIATADAPRLAGGRLRAPRFSWLPGGWRQFPDIAVLPGGPSAGSTFATSWRYRPAPHGPAGALPTGGVLVTVQVLKRPHGELIGSSLSDLPARPQGELEGHPGVPEYRARAVCGARAVEVRVAVAAPRLTAARREQLRRMLDALVLPPAAQDCGGGP